MLTMRMTWVLIPSDTVARCRERRETLALGVSALTPTGRQQRLPPHRYCAPSCCRENWPHMINEKATHTLPRSEILFYCLIEGAPLAILQKSEN